MSKIICGNHPDIIERMIDLKIVPPNCRRVVIDMNLHSAIIMYYECYADKKIIELDLPKQLSEAMQIREGGVKSLQPTN